VLGGNELSGSLASAELYDPSSGSWSPIASLVEGQYGAESSATLLLDGRVLVVGGASSTKVVASAELYDPSKGTWTATASMTETRLGHTATRLPNGTVLVAGGYRASAGGTSWLASAELYDPGGGT
jgi:N-acetylneuraminic acid mutarotase